MTETLKKYAPFLTLFFFALLAYIPNITEFGYFRDDWYMMYSANAMGARIFSDIFAIDRPARGMVLAFFYSIFGLNPLYYNISAVAFRLLGALSFYWTLRMMWPKQERALLVASSLYLLFPGFLSTPNAIDFQPHQVGLFFANLSIALSVKALENLRVWQKAFLWLVSGVLAAVYLGLVDHFAGMEVFRLAAILVVVNHRDEVPLQTRLRNGVAHWVIFSVGTAVFAIWRFFFFTTERKATDIGAQLGLFFSSPLLVGIEWLRTLTKDVLEVVVLAWSLPLATLWNTPLRMRELLFAVLLTTVSILIAALAVRGIGVEKSPSSADSDQWRFEAFWVGIATAVAGFLPVILSNRDADLGGLSRYMLASAAGSVILMAAFIDQFKSKKVLTGVFCFLIGSSVLTHYFNGTQWAASARDLREFWWQVSWRVPQIEPGTTLVVNYAQTAIEEDYFVWGPANLIYYPESTSLDKVRPALWGLVLNSPNTEAILAGDNPMMIERRSIVTYMGYNNILVLTQPTPNSCVQVIDGNYPVTSDEEEAEIRAIAGMSNQTNIRLDESLRQPAKSIFGSEPERGWCYYYESAALAFQKGEYETVLKYLEEANRMGFSAADAAEWMPFLQAAVVLEDEDTLLMLARQVKKSESLQQQACNLLTTIENAPETMRQLSQRTFCVPE